MNCSSSEYALDITAPASINASVFDVSFNRTQDSDGHPTLKMTYLYMKAIDEHCNGTVAVETCSIRTATVSYNLLQVGRDIRLLRNSYPKPLSIVPSLGDLPGPDDSPAGALTALHSLGNSYLTSSVILAGLHNGSYGTESEGTLEMEYDEPNPTRQGALNSSCRMLYTNSTDDVLWRMHEIMFRMARAASTGKQLANILTQHLL